jgi:hypothetical protein
MEKNEIVFIHNGRGGGTAYRCDKCMRLHNPSSKIGKEHRKYYWLYKNEIKGKSKDLQKFYIKVTETTSIPSNNKYK